MAFSSLVELIPAEMLDKLRRSLAEATNASLDLYGTDGLPLLQPDTDQSGETSAVAAQLVAAALAQGEPQDGAGSPGRHLRAEPVYLEGELAGVAVASLPPMALQDLHRAANAWTISVEALARQATETARQRQQVIRFQEDVEERMVQQTAQLVSRNRELSALNSLSSALAQTMDPDILLGILLEKAIGLVSAVDAGIVLNFSEVAGRLLPAAALGLELDSLAGLSFLPGEGIVGQSFQGSQPVFILSPTQVQECQSALPENTRRILQATQLDPKNLFQSAAFPLMVQDRKLGVAVFLDRRGETLLTPEDLNLLRSMCNQTAVVLDNARMYEKIRYQVQEAETFSRFSEKAVFMDDEQALLNAATEVIEQLIPSQGGFITLTSSDGKAKVVKGWDAGVAYLDRTTEVTLCPALRRHKVLGPRDAGQPGTCSCPFALPKPGYYLCVPLTAMGHTLGGIHIFHSQPWAFKEDSASLLHRLADFLALAMENIRLLDNTRRQAITDALTGLHNFRFFQDYLLKQLAQVDRSHSSLALLVMDLDHFKQVNDTYGHEAGDLVLQSFARTVEGAVRKNDLVARYGGEEFVAVLAESDREQAQWVAERIRVAVEHCRTPLPDGRELTVTVSIGVACYPPASEMQSLFRAADAALYLAKEKGRNRVEISSARKTPRQGSAS